MEKVYSLKEGAIYSDINRKYRMYGYVYMTTNSINNKKYIGQHKANEFDEKYLGSGIALLNAIKLYGISSFKCEILKECETKEQLDEAEIYYIKEYDAVNSNDFYNITSGGSMCRIEHMSEETKRKISNSNKGKKRTPEMVKKNSESKKGSKWMNNGETQQYVLRKYVDKYLSDGWVYGMIPGRKSSPASEQRKERISNALKGKKKPQSVIDKHRKSLVDKNRHWYTNGKESILISDMDEIPNGYYLGRTVSEESKEKNRLSHLNKNKT